LIANQTREGRHEKGERKEALRRTQEFAQLFLLPGVGHCGGGAGADNFDAGTPLAQWVEHGIAPARLPVDASDLPIRSGGAMAQRDQRA